MKHRYLLLFCLIFFVMVSYGGSSRMESGEEADKTQMTASEPADHPESSLSSAGPGPGDNAEWEDFEVIAHALGGIGGFAYLNCREGFLQAYQQGCRLFEVDLVRTADLRWVCRHSWTDSLGQWDSLSSVRLTYPEFLSRPLMGKYTPLSLEDLFRLMMDYPDVYVMLDSKHYSIRNFRNTLQDYSEILQTARDTGSGEVLDRMIPEIYNEAMFPGIAMLHDFPAFVFSVWEDQTLEEMEQTAVFCKENGIKAVNIKKDKWDSLVQTVFDSRGVDVYLYTVNDPAEAAEYYLSGVKGICTDWLTPQSLQAGAASSW